MAVAGGAKPCRHPDDGLQPRQIISCRCVLAESSWIMMAPCICGLVAASAPFWIACCALLEEPIWIPNLLSACAPLWIACCAALLLRLSALPSSC